MLFDLSCLLYEVRKNFFTMNLDDYCEACFEVGRLAALCGFSQKDMAKMLCGASGEEIPTPKNFRDWHYPCFLPWEFSV